MSLSGNSAAADWLFTQLLLAWMNERPGYALIAQQSSQRIWQVMCCAFIIVSLELVLLCVLHVCNCRWLLVLAMQPC